jgi:hypothetical protein
MAFSVMINATEGHSVDVHTFMDRLCALFLASNQ